LRTVCAARPDTAPGVARRADQAGSSSMGPMGAVSSPASEELTVFAAAAAVTENIRLPPNVVFAPARSTAEPAEQAVSVQEFSGGRHMLGVGSSRARPTRRSAAASSTASAGPPAACRRRCSPRSSNASAARSATGPEGQARIMALVYYSLGDTDGRFARLPAQLLRGHGRHDHTWPAALHSPEAIRSAIDAYASVGVDELILDPDR
jgi:hypothetical protein